MFRFTGEDKTLQTDRQAVIVFCDTHFSLFTGGPNWAFRYFDNGVVGLCVIVGRNIRRSSDANSRWRNQTGHVWLQDWDWTHSRKNIKPDDRFNKGKWDCGKLAALADQLGKLPMFMALPRDQTRLCAERRYVYRSNSSTEKKFQLRTAFFLQQA